jgi:sulfatase maturation enzyme AslB (radical SAM superfamily)
MPSWKEIVKAAKKLVSKRVKLRMLPIVACLKEVVYHMPSWKEIVKAAKKLVSKRVKLRILPLQNPQKTSHDHSGHRRTEETKALGRQFKATESSKGSRS